MRPRRILAALAVAICAAAPAAAQTRVIRVASKLLGEERVIHVNLPPNYGVARQRYNVIYLLDGHVREFFDLTVAAAAYDLTGDPHEYAAPTQIVVGIDQRDRGADLSRDAEQFTRFIVEELVPFIDREYRTTRYRTLIGHSLGGRFALMMFCRAPGVFPSVIAISGAGADSAGGPTTRCLQQSFANDGSALRQLVISAGEREPGTLAGVRRLGEFLRASAPSNWRWTVVDGAGLGHTGTPYATIPPGLRFLNDASVWEMPASLADSVTQGLGEPNATMSAFYARLSARVGVPVVPSRKWLLNAARIYMKGPDNPKAEEAVRRVIEAYPEDLEAYGMLSEVAQQRRDYVGARRALDDAMRVLDRLDWFDVYDRERKRQILKDALALIPR